MTTPRIRMVAATGIFIFEVFASTASAQRQMESLGRGVVAIREDDGKIFVGWRLLGTDPDDIAFNVYRSTGSASAREVEPRALEGRDAFRRQGCEITGGPLAISSGRCAAVGKGRRVRAFRLPADAPTRPYISIPLQTLPGHTPNDASVGDLDGDGEYEIVLKQEMRGRDNSQAGKTGETKLEAYKLDGRFLWRINLGKNIREGAHYTQFMVYDLDGDGKAEVVCKTADGTVDGRGHRSATPRGLPQCRWFILEGPEFLTVFEGATGKALATTAYIPPRERRRIGATTAATGSTAFSRPLRISMARGRA